MERSGKITLSLETAKRYWNSGNKDLMEIATMLYSKNELERLTKEELSTIVYNKYPNLWDTMSAMNWIHTIAKYFNKDWKKEDNQIGYFYSYDNTKKEWVLREHNTVTYPGIVYYKNKNVATEAFEYLEEYYNELIK